jgi:hypothetical protein
MGRSGVIWAASGLKMTSVVVILTAMRRMSIGRMNFMVK